MKQKILNTWPVTDPTAILEHLVGFKDVRVLAYRNDKGVHMLNIMRVLKPEDTHCPLCKERGYKHGSRQVRLIDLPCMGRPVRLVWVKQRLRCSNKQCSHSWMLQDPRIASRQCSMSTRASKWCVSQVMRGQTYAQIARDLQCDWHTVERAVLAYGPAVLRADKQRIRQTHAIGLDETAFLSNQGNHGHGTHYVTTLCDTVHGTIIDLAPNRDAYEVARLLASQSEQWRQHIRFGTLDLSSLYRKVYAIALPNATCIADPFHVIQLANRTLDAIRRRVQWDTQHHRGRKTDPLYQIRRRLLTSIEKLQANVAERVTSMLTLGDPSGEVTLAWRVKEALRDLYKITDPAKARKHLEHVITTCQRSSSPHELNTLAKTLQSWKSEILAYIEHRYSNGPTEGINNRIKKIKRDGYGFTNFNNYRLRVLLQLGGAHETVLKGILIP